jgi:hypothetical protein
MFDWEDIDQHDPDLSDQEQTALRWMMDKAGDYISRGEKNKAHGCMAATIIFYSACKGACKDDDQPTGHMPL